MGRQLLDGVLGLKGMDGAALGSIVGTDGERHWLAVPGMEYKVFVDLDRVRTLLEPQSYRNDKLRVELFADGEKIERVSDLSNRRTCTLGAWAGGKGYNLRFVPSKREAGEVDREAGEHKDLEQVGKIEAKFSYCPAKHWRKRKAQTTVRECGVKGTEKVATKGRKFYEAAAVGTQLSPKTGATSTTSYTSDCERGKHCARQPVCKAVLYYDTAENLFLRGLLDRSNPTHAALLPKEEEFVNLVLPGTLGARSASEAFTEEICDLTGEEQVWSSVHKRPKVEVIE